MKLAAVVLALVFVGTVRIAQFLCACFCILFFGVGIYELFFKRKTRDENWRAA